MMYMERRGKNASMTCSLSGHSGKHAQQVSIHKLLNCTETAKLEHCKAGTLHSLFDVCVCVGGGAWVFNSRVFLPCKRHNSIGEHGDTHDNGASLLMNARGRFQ